MRKVSICLMKQLQNICSLLPIKLILNISDLFLGAVTLKPSDFFDEEAELSESEWGSADEDEKDLDALEMELGDTEKYDEKQLRTDLEKIHMRRILDEDQKEV